MPRCNTIHGIVPAACSLRLGTTAPRGVVAVSGEACVSFTATPIQVEELTVSASLRSWLLLADRPISVGYALLAGPRPGHAQADEIAVVQLKDEVVHRRTAEPPL